jgi:prepilin-type processing-associated H-X9-DG protein
MRSARRNGFTFTELLVLLAMALIVTFLGASVVNKGRETANRIGCASNLRALGLAAHAYSDTYKSLPPGWWGSIPFDQGLVVANPAGGNPRIGPGNGPFPQLLPFLKQDVVYKQVSNTIPWDPKLAVQDMWSTKNNHADYNFAAFQVACSPLKFLQCPADSDVPLAKVDIDGTGSPRAYYVISSATFTFTNGGRPGQPNTATADDPTAVDWGQSGRAEWSGYTSTDAYEKKTAAYNPMARVNYLPVAGLGQGKSPFYTQFEGVFTDRSATKLTTITAADGTANTLMFGETSGQFFPGLGDNGLQQNLFAAVGTATHRGLQQRCSPHVSYDGKPVALCDNKSFVPAPGQKARFGTFSSPHPAGVQFCFCDGSVRLIAVGKTYELGSADWYVFQQMAGFHDGFHRDTHGLSP